MNFYNDEKNIKMSSQDLLRISQTINKLSDLDPLKMDDLDV